MDEKALKRRNWVKNIAIIFLAVMLVLTLFSNTIMNYSLPEVSAQYCYSGTITTSIRGSGTVEAKETYAVTAASSGTIKDIGIKVGSRVEIGDIMFLLEDEGGANLITALEDLAKLKEEYNTTQAGLSGDYLDKQLAINEAQTAVSEARAKRTAADKAKQQLVAVTVSYNAAVKLVAKLTNQKAKVDGKISVLEALPGIDEVNATLDAAKIEMETLKTALNNAKADQTAAENALEAAKDDAYLKAEVLTDANEARDEFITQNAGTTVDEATLTAKIRAVDDLERQYNYDLADYNTKQKAYSDNILLLFNQWQELLNQPHQTAAVESDETTAETTVIVDQATLIAQAEKAYNDAVNNASEALKKLQRALEDSAINLQYQKEDLAILQEKYDNSQDYANRLQHYKDAADNANVAKKAADKAVISAENTKTEAIAAVEDGQKAYDDAKKMVELLTSADSLASLKTESQSLDTQIEKANAEETAIEDNKNELTTTAADTVTDSAIKSLENTVTKLQNELAVLKEKDSATTEVVQMKLDIINQKITEKEAAIEKIKSGDNSVEVKAPIAGVINSIKVIAGNKIQLNDQLAEIQLVDKGYSVSFTVTTEQAKRIKAGDMANIQNWWGNNITAVVEKIIPDQANPAQNKIVTLNITGDISVGTSLSFTIGQNSMDYESVIPNSAVREDNNGKFVLIVEAKSTPLGNRYTARRMEIQVIAADDTSSAVSGITYGDFVITASTEPVIAGKQVRLIES